jgi:hypothetical protein
MDSLDVSNILSNIDLWYFIALLIGLVICVIGYNKFRSSLRRK